MTIERTLASAGDGPILIALSGGGDSVALLHLLVERVGPARLRAVVVDHALRQGSASDALRAAGFARDLGVDVERCTLEWISGPPAPSPASFNHAGPFAGEGAGGPRKRSQAAARGKRYAALCEAAHIHGARVIAVAHSADDQAETVLMRAAAGSGWRGLAGMAEIAPAPVWPEGRGLVVARPLLDMRRTALRELLAARGAEWIEDPANSNAAFERVRIRARLAGLERDGFDSLQLVRFAAHMRALADEVDAEALALLRRAVRFEGGEIVIDPSLWRAPLETRQRALAVLIAAAAGAEREPQPAALSRLETRLIEPSFRGASLGGARLRRTRAALHITRDRGAVEGRAGVAPLPPLELSPHAEIVWDGRLALTAASPLRLSPAADAPRIVRDGEVISLAEAESRGLVSARWLLEQHAIQQLGPLSTTNPGP